MVERYNENIRAYIRGYFYGNEVWLFSVKGYEATSMAQISDAVGVRRASPVQSFSFKRRNYGAVSQSKTGGIAGSM